MGPTVERIGRPFRTAPAALLAGLLLLAAGAAAAAEDAAPPAPAADASVWPDGTVTLRRNLGTLHFEPPTDPTWRQRRGFVDALFLPKFNTQVQRLGAGDLATFPGQRLDEQIFYESLNERAYAGFERAAGRAVREYVLEYTTFGQLLDDLGDDVSSRRLRSLSGKAMGVDVNFAHLAPELVLKPRLAEGTLRLTLNAGGSLGIRYRNAHLLGGTRVGAKFDPVEERYTFSCLVGF